jgi:hypothetical protein
MKYNALLVITFTCLSFISCKNDEIAQKSLLSEESIILEKNEFIETSTINNSSNINSIKVELTKIVDVEKYDFSKIYKTTLINKNEPITVVFSVSSLAKKDDMLAFMVDSKNQITLSLTAKSDIINKKINCEIFNSGTSFDIDYGKKKVTDKSFLAIKSSGARISGCGQGTIDCINDAYTSHGWTSVYLFVQSAYLPATAVAIAGACALRNCGSHH